MSSTTPENKTPTDTPPSTGSRGERLLRVVAVLAALVALYTGWLTLTGYGHSFVYLNRFGLRPEEVGLTSGDFLLRSWPFILHAMDPLTEMGKTEWWTVAVKRIFDLLAVPALAATLIVGLGYAALSCAWFKAFWARAVARAVALTSVEQRKLTIWAWIAFMPWLGPLVVVLVGLAAYYLAASLTVLGTILAPLMGASSGEARVNKEVLVGSCQAANSKDLGVRCVKVFRGGAEVGAGRVIERTPTRIYLYRRCDRATLTFDLEQTDLESAASLGPTDLDATPCPPKSEVKPSPIPKPAD